MTTLARSSTKSGLMAWLARAESWMDARGKFAWIAAMVLGFIFAWPVGLALLAYMIWSRKMSCSQSRNGDFKRSHHMQISGNSGNSAFDAYRDETLRRLQDEQTNFESFLDRLRQAKDKAEFDQFMQERADVAATPPESNSDSDAGPSSPRSS